LRAQHFDRWRCGFSLRFNFSQLLRCQLPRAP
jgi:hypothetical protein